MSKYTFTENPIVSPRPRWREGSLVVVGIAYPYVYQTDKRPFKPYQFFQDADTFAQPQKQSIVSILEFNYVYQNDVRRASRAAVFEDAPTFPQAQHGSYPVVLVSYTTGPPFNAIVTKSTHVIDNVIVSRSQRGNIPGVVNFTPVLTICDVVTGQDTFGWPESSFNENPFPKPRTANLISVMNFYPSYNPATDVRRAARAVVFEDAPTFLQQQVGRVAILNTYVPYNYRTDRRRLTRDVTFEEAPTFVSRMPFSQIVVNGQAAILPFLEVPNVVGEYYFEAQLEILHAGFQIAPPVWVLSPYGTQTGTILGWTGGGSALLTVQGSLPANLAPGSVITDTVGGTVIPAGTTVVGFLGGNIELSVDVAESPGAPTAIPFNYTYQGNGVLPQYVISQSPAAGTTYPLGSAITITITVSAFTATLQPGVPEPVP
jgi:hypothetical protein